jgi:PhoH-like ATPase
MACCETPLYLYLYLENKIKIYNKRGNNMAKVVVDTNYLIEQDDLEDLIKQYEVVIPLCVLEELDNLNHTSNDQSKKYKIRNAIRFIESNLDKITVDTNNYIRDKNDNKILDSCIENKAKLITFDVAMKIKAKAFDIECVELNNTKDIYKGYREVTLDEFEQANFYSCMINKWNLLENEYLILKDLEGNIIDKLKWSGHKFENLNYKKIDSKYVGKVSPRNIQQELMLDLLQDNKTKVKVVTGGYGTGKDYLGLANFLHYLDKGKFEKIIWIRNNVEALTSETKQIGYLPGNLNEKLAVFADLVSDFLGGKLGFDMLINSGKLEIVHTGFLRGRDFRNSLIYCTESQNMTPSLIQLILSRISENSMIYFNGDIKQADAGIFKQNSGLNKMIEKFKGNENFGFVHLEKTERSKIAEMASLLD